MVHQNWTENKGAARSKSSVGQQTNQDPAAERDMFPLMRGLWRARRARKAAVATIGPLVTQSRHRLNGIADTCWLDPYMAGFVVMLITLVARRAATLDNQNLGLVQCDAWAEITGVRWSLIGEEVLHLSATGDKEFEAGCRNAIAFDLALYGTSMAGVAPVHLDGAKGEFDRYMHTESNLSENPDIRALWMHYFDAHIT